MGRATYEIQGRIEEERIGKPTKADKSFRSLQEQIDETDIAGDDAPKRHPLHYWDDLRNSSSTFETRPASSIYRVNINNETVRLAHVIGLHPYSEILASGTRLRIDSLVHVQASVFLAMHHFNERSSAVIPDLPDILRDCNVYMTVDMLDTLLSPLEASRKLLDYYVRSEGVLSEPLPIALHGAARSAVSQSLSVLAGLYDTPQVNGVSTSSALNIKDSYPTFTRTIPTNELDSKATVTYLKSLGVSHFGVLFIRDTYGSEFKRGLERAAAGENMTVVSAAWDDGDEASIVSALQKLHSTQFRYFFAILSPATETHKTVIRNALDLGMMGNPEYVWLFSEASTLVLEDSFFTATLNSSISSDREIASALNGAGLIILDIPVNEGFDRALREMRTDEELFDYYVSRTVSLAADVCFRAFTFHESLTSVFLLILGCTRAVC